MDEESVTTTELPRGAGILFIADGKVLLVRRGSNADHPGTWVTPGGGLEDGEDFLDAALREVREEVGYTVPVEAMGSVEDLIRRDTEGTDYKVFLCRLDAPFDAVLPKGDDENVDAQWFTPADVPPNLHPGTAMAIKRLGMDELDIAEAIRDGELTSPQHFHNVWLFAMRITGVRWTYRKLEGGEFAWRNPADYLNDRFVKRCNGLAVIWEHPTDSFLDTGEYASRSIGSIFLPYIKADEVWGVAKVYDEGAAQAMDNGQFSSTSPAVLVARSAKQDMGDGSHLLIEGKPVLLDHLAICKLGVWDKLQAPTGVETTGDQTVADEKAKESKAEAHEEKAEAEKKMAGADREEAKADAAKEPGAILEQFLDKMGGKIDAMCSRMDAIEGKITDSAKKDSEEPKAGEAEKIAADKAKADAMKKDAAKEESEAEAVKAAKLDAGEAKKRADAAAEENGKLKDRLDALERSTPRMDGDADYNEMADMQAKADSVYSSFGIGAHAPHGGRAPPAMRRETKGAYGRRLARPLQDHSKQWKGVDLSSLPDAAFAVAEHQIYTDAMEVASNPADIPAGQLRQVTRVDPDTGQRMHTFYGQETFIKTDMKPRRIRGKIHRPAKEVH